MLNCLQSINSSEAPTGHQPLSWLEINASSRFGVNIPRGSGDPDDPTRSWSRPCFVFFCRWLCPSAEKDYFCTCLSFLNKCHELPPIFKNGKIQCENFETPTSVISMSRIGLNTTCPYLSRPSSAKNIEAVVSFVVPSQCWEEVAQTQTIPNPISQPKIYSQIYPTFAGVVKIQPLIHWPRCCMSSWKARHDSCGHANALNQNEWFHYSWYFMMLSHHFFLQCYCIVFNWPSGC